MLIETSSSSPTIVLYVNVGVVEVPLVIWRSFKFPKKLMENLLKCLENVKILKARNQSTGWQVKNHHETFFMLDGD